MNNATSIAHRLSAAVEKVTESGCWIWMGREWRGYGLLSVKSKNTRAHRISYEVHIGPIPDGMIVCHSCDVRSCINPDHLWIGTVKDNNNDALQKGRQRNGNMGKTHCPKGHEYAGPNLVIREQGRRGCKVCRNEVLRNKRRRKQALQQARGRSGGAANQGAGT